MSLLLFFLYWVGIPVLVVAIAAWLWRSSCSPAARSLIVVCCIAALLTLLWWAVGDRWVADRQVRELCAKDGGVRVYERVRLSPYEHEYYASKNWLLPDKSQAASGDKYYTETDIHYYRQGFLSVSRRQYRVIRRSDGRVLGESISYGRAGGDLPGPWHYSTFKCPDPVRQPSHIEAEIFSVGSD